jgi:hypothetical protein
VCSYVGKEGDSFLWLVVFVVGLGHESSTCP